MQTRSSKTRKSSAASGLLALCLVAAGFGSAASQPESDPNSSQSLFDEGVKHFDAKDYKKACPKLQASVQLNPNLLEAQGMLASCYRLSGKLASAWTVFRDVRLLAKRDNNQKALAIAENNITDLEPKLAKITLARPSAANVVVRKDKTVVPADGFGSGLAVDAGKHTITAEATGFKTWSQDFEIADGEQKTIEIPALEAIPESAKPLETPTSMSTTIARPLLSTPRWVAVGVAGLGIVSLGIGTWAGLDARASRDDARKSGCNEDLSMCDNDVALSTANNAYSRGKLATGFFIGSAVLVGAAAVIWFVVPDRESEAKPSTSWKFAPAVDPEHVGVVLGRSL